MKKVWRPVARLVPAVRLGNEGFPDLSGYRALMPTLGRPLSQAVAEDRADRL